MIIPKAPVVIPDEVLKERLDGWAARSSRFPWFKGSSKDLSEWFIIVEEACEANFVVESQWSDAAILFISGDLQPVMEERKAKFLEQSGEKHWKWADFKDDIRRVVVEAERIVEEARSKPLDKAKDSIAQFRQDHPYIVASASAGLVIGGSMVLIPTLGILTLKAIGFTAGGVAARTLASVIQGIYYGGTTTGVLSVLQSIGSRSTATSGGAVEPSPTDVGERACDAGSNSVETITVERTDHEAISNVSSSDAPPPYKPADNASQPAAPVVNYPVYTPKRRRT